MEVSRRAGARDDRAGHGLTSDARDMAHCLRSWQLASSRHWAYGMSWNYAEPGVRHGASMARSDEAHCACRVGRQRLPHAGRMKASTCVAQQGAERSHVYDWIDLTRMGRGRGRA